MLRAWWVLRLSGPFRVGAELAALVRGVPGLSPSQLAETDWVAGSALQLLGDVARACAHFDTGLALAVASGHRHCEARLLTAAADERAAEGRHREGLDNLTRGLNIARELADQSLQCLVLNGLGRLSDYQGHLEDARGFYEAALELARALGDRRLEGGLLGNLGGLHHDHGRLDDARTHYELALALAREVGDRRWEGNARCNLGLVHHEQSHTAQARSQFDAALTLARDVGHVRLECTVLCNLGISLEAQGEFDAAQIHHERAVLLAHDLGDRRLEGQFRGYLGLSLARLGRFGESKACLDAGEALLLAASDALSLGLLLCSRSEADHLAGDDTAAQGWWRRAQALAAQSGVGTDSELGRGLLRLRELLEPADAARAG
jgi:tetratricopeptide (TPR) repeat protein